jgi:hypothetical protein
MRLRIFLANLLTGNLLEQTYTAVTIHRPADAATPVRNQLQSDITIRCAPDDIGQPFNSYVPACLELSHRPLTDSSRSCNLQNSQP